MKPNHNWKWNLIDILHIQKCVVAFQANAIAGQALVAHRGPTGVAHDHGPEVWFNISMTTRVAPCGWHCVGALGRKPNSFFSERNFVKIEHFRK